MKSNKLYLILAYILFTGCNRNETIETQNERPNILLIVADDLGFSDLGSFGGEIHTPNIDELAFSGIRSTAFYTAPTCSPTRAMLLTGVDNHRNGYGTMEGDWAGNQVGLPGYEGYLNFDVVTFPKLMQDNGYYTSMTGKWHQAYPATDTTLWPNKRGFDRSFCLLQGGAGHFSDQQPLFSFFERSYYQENGKIVEELPEEFYSTDYYAKKAIEFIDESQKLKKPFMTYIAFTSPHWPLQVPDEFIELYKGKYDQGYEILAKTRLENMKKFGIIPQNVSLPPLSPNVVPWDELSDLEKVRSARTMEIYAAMIERLDANVGKIIDHLKLIGQFENTFIVFMADNGAEGNMISGIADTREWIEKNFDNSLENIGRKNSYVFTGPSWAQVSTLPFKWYKAFATEGGVRCPLIINYPGGIKQAGTVNNDFISVMDLAPTFLELAGVKHPGNFYQRREIYPLDGTSLISWIEGEERFPHPQQEAHCWELYGRRGVRKGIWKAEWQDKPYGKDDWELYDLDKDPAELMNLADAFPEKLKELLADWDQYAQKYKVTLPNEKVAYGVEEVWEIRD